MNTEEIKPTHHDAQVPAGLNAGETFHLYGREYVAIGLEDGSLIASEVVRMVPTDLQDPHPNNRKQCDAQALAALVESIGTKGQTTTAILRKMPGGRYQQIAGWRRALACAALGIPLRAHVREMSDVEALEQLYLENAQREDLRPLDEAELIEAMLDLRDGENRRLFTLERVAIARFGSAKPGAIAQVRQKRLLLQLPAELKDAVNRDELKLNIAWLVARIADPADREEAGKKVMKDPMTGQPMTFKRAGEMIRATYQVSLKGWEHMERTDLLNDEQKALMGFTGQPGEAGDGSCERCPFLARNHEEYKDEVACSGGGKGGSGESGISPTTCTRARCHQMKLESLWQAQAGELAKKHNAKVLPRDFDDQHLYSTLDEKPTGHQMGDWSRQGDPKLPTWKQILKGSDVPLVVMPDEDDAGDIIPVLAVEDSLAIQVGKATHPELFANAKVPGQTTGAKGDIKALTTKQAAGELTEDEKKALDALLEQQEQQRLDQVKREMDNKVKQEAKTDCLKTLLERITAKGAGLDVLKALATSIFRRLEYASDLLVFLTGKPVPDEDGYDENIASFEKLLRGQTVNGLQGICAVASVWDDVYYSGIHTAEDFTAMCKAAKIDPREIEATVRKAHQLAFRAAEKERKDKLKKAARDTAKNSVDPKRVSSAHEAEVTAAADAVAREKLQTREFKAGDAIGMVDAMVTAHVEPQQPNENGVLVNPQSFKMVVSPKVSFTIRLAAVKHEGKEGAWLGYGTSRDYECGDASGASPVRHDETHVVMSAALYEQVQVLQGSFAGTSKHAAAGRKALQEVEKLLKVHAERDTKAWHAKHNPQPESGYDAAAAKAGDYFHCDDCGGVCAVGADLVKDVEDLPTGEFKCEECADGQLKFGVTFPLVANQEAFEAYVPDDGDDDE